MRCAAAVVLLFLVASARAEESRETPLEPVVTQEEAKLLESVSKLPERTAISRLRGAIRPGSSAALHYALGVLLTRTDRLEEAERAHREAIRGLPTFARAWSALGRVLLLREMPREAAEALARVIELGRGRAETWKLLGYAHLLSERNLAALAAYRQALALAPEDPEVKNGYAQALLADRRYLEARPLLEEMCREAPRRSESWRLLANTHLALEDRDGAAEILMCARRVGGIDAEGLLLLGDLHYNRGLHAAAVEIYESPEIRSDLSADRLVGCAEALFLTGRAEKAETLLGRVAAKEGGRTARALLLSARIAEARGREADARTACEAALEADPLLGEAALLLGDLLTRDGETERARIVLERASRIRGYEVRALVALAQIEVDADAYEKAVEHLEQAVSLSGEPRLLRYLEQVRRLVNRE